MALRPLDHVKHLVPMRLKALAKEAYLRGAFWKEGGTPDFLLVGVMKGGSTSLYNYLVQHPQIVPALGKEIWYLGGYNAWRGETWYRRHFIDGARKRALEEQLGAALITGEASVDSMRSVDAIRRAHQLNPEMRVVALLRDPVKRLVSQYRFLRQLGYVFPGDLDAVTRDQLARLRESPPRAETLPQAPVTETLVSDGMYSLQLRPWYEAFGRERVLVLPSERMFRDAAGVCREVFGFLGVDAEVEVELEVHNVTKKSAGAAAVLSPATRADLHAFYREANADLAELTGQDFGWDR